MSHIKKRIAAIIGRWKTEHNRTKEIQATYRTFAKNQVALDKGEWI